MESKLKRPEIIRVYDKDLECRGHGMYTGGEMWYKGKPFTGFVVDDYHPNGNVAAEQEHVNGQTMGWNVVYNEEGNIIWESLEYGATGVCFKEFDENGNIIAEGFTAPKEFYNRVAAETGMEPIKLDE